MKEVEDYEAVALFLDRARSARPGLVVAPEDVAALTSICYHLGRHPIGLGAGRGPSAGTEHGRDR